jgi:flagellar biosynthetic protein FlhB
LAEDLGEKTEQPTGRRRGEARNKGQVGKSADFGSAVVLTGAVVAMVFYTKPLLDSMKRIMRYPLSPEGLDPFTADTRITTDTTIIAIETAKVLVPIMLILVAVAYFSGVSQVGFMLARESLKPSFSRMNPVKGVEKLFSKRTFVKGGIDLLKVLVIALVVWILISQRKEQLLSLAGLPLLEGIVNAARLMLEVAIWVLVVLFALGITDLVYQKWQTTEDLKMTRHEVKDERKSTEGDIETKRRRFNLARQMAMQRIQQDVPQADVVVTNPTHFSVALKYDTKRSDAPRVIAKGADYLALRIRQVAAAASIPIIERPPLARSLYANVEIGQEINPEHFEAVAEVLAYVYKLEGRQAPQGSPVPA